MNIKEYLQKIQNLIPNFWLEQLQHIHANLLVRWILFRGSQPLAFSQKSVMVFSPHQDDETFGCGGMIARKREQGISVVVVFLTDGQGTGNSDTESKTKIVQIRKQEAIKALTILGVEVSKIYFLDQQDGKLLDLKINEKHQTILQIAELLKNYQPGEVYVPHKKDCHRDHEASYELVKAAIIEAGVKVELIQYPIWLFWRAPLFIMLKLRDIAAAYCLSITSVQEKKNQAIAAYTSQLDSLPQGFVQRFFSNYEIFFKADN